MNESKGLAQGPSVAAEVGFEACLV